MSLLALNVSGPTDADVPAARLGGAPGLNLLREPEPADARLDLPPRHILQQDLPPTLGSRLRRASAVGFGTIVVHLGFAAAFLVLLTWRPDAPPQEKAIPVEVVAHVPEPPRPPDPPKPAPKPVPEIKKPAPVAIPSPPKLDPQTPQPAAEAPPAPQPPAPPPPLVAAPPDAPAAATQNRESKIANLEPDRDRIDQATHEARPADVPPVLTTPDQNAGFAVAPHLDPKPDPTPGPAAVKKPSEADKLAAALPMDVSALPLTFRAVLSGHGAEISAAYKGVVYGHFNRTPEIGERARRQHLKGQVIVAFTIDRDGKVTKLAVLQSSGSAAVDALGLEIVQAGAPYPPPPPDAERSFTPAFAFGE